MRENKILRLLNETVLCTREERFKIIGDVKGIVSQKCQ